MGFREDGYVSALLTSPFLSEYFFRDTLKDIDPSITEEKIKSLEAMGLKAMLKYCMDSNPARTYELASQKIANTLAEMMRQYIGAVGLKAVDAESREEFIKYTNLFLELRRGNRLLIEEFAPDINDVLSQYGGSDVIWELPAKGTIPYAAKKFNEMLPPEDTEDRILELLSVYRRKRSLARCEGHKAFVKAMGGEDAESVKDVEDDVNAALRKLEAEVNSIGEKTKDGSP
jgi:hypothetical protein